MLINFIKSINNSNNSSNNAKESELIDYYSEIKNIETLNKEMKRLKLENISLKEKIKILDDNFSKECNNNNKDLDNKILEEVLNKCSKLEESIIIESKFLNFLDELSNEFKNILTKTVKIFLDSNQFKSFIIDLENLHLKIEYNTQITKNESNKDFFIKYFDNLKLIRTNFLYTFYKTTFSNQEKSNSCSILYILKELLNKKYSKALKEIINTIETIYCVDELDKDIMLDITQELSENKTFTNNIVQRLFLEIISFIDLKASVETLNNNENKTLSQESNKYQTNINKDKMFNNIDVKEDLNLDLDIDFIENKDDINNDFYFHKKSNNAIFNGNKLINMCSMEDNQIEEVKSDNNFKNEDDLKKENGDNNKQIDHSIRNNIELEQLQINLKNLELYNLKLIEEKDLIIQNLNLQIDELSRKNEILSSKSELFKEKNSSNEMSSYEKLEEIVLNLREEVNKLNIKNRNLEDKLINELRLNENVIDKRIIKKQIFTILNPNIDTDIKDDILENLSDLLSLTDDEKNGLKLNNKNNESNLGKISNVFYKSLFDD